MLPNSGTGVATSKDVQIAELQEKLADALDKRCEERYWWIAVVVFLGDFLVFSGKPSLLIVIALIFELMAGVYWAKKMGLEDVVVIMDRLLQFATEQLSRKKSKDAN